MNCYGWVDPCFAAPDPCAEAQQPGACAPTVQWFWWLAAAVAGAVVIARLK